MNTKTTKLLGLGIAAISFLLVTIPVIKSGVVYADSGDHNDNGDHNHDHNDNHDRDHGDHDHDHD